MLYLGVQIFKNVHSFWIIFVCNMGGGCWRVGWMVCILKNYDRWMWLLGCGGRFYLIFPSELWFDTYIWTDSRDLANGYLLCTYLSPSIYWMPLTTPPTKWHYRVICVVLLIVKVHLKNNINICCICSQHTYLYIICCGKYIRVVCFNEY
jgi:hypothetical protein